MRRLDQIWVRRVVIVGVWLTIVVAWRYRQQQTGLGTLETAQRFIDQVEANWWGPVAFVAAYLLRPLLLFPASVMTVAAGLIFGPVVGVLIVIVAANASAMIAFAVGRTIAGAAPETTDGAVTNDGAVTDERAGLVARWGRRLRDRSFETVLVMRLLFLPYDLVNYVCGALRIRPGAFLAATAIGTLPGTVSFVLLGASLERIDEGLDGIDPWAIVASVAVFALSLLGARVARRRDDRSNPAEQPPSRLEHSHG